MKIMRGVNIAGQVELVLWNGVNVCKQRAAWDSLKIPMNVYSRPPRSLPPPAAAMPVVTYAEQHRACAKPYNIAVSFITIHLILYRDNDCFIAHLAALLATHLKNNIKHHISCHCEVLPVSYDVL